MNRIIGVRQTPPVHVEMLSLFFSTFSHVSSSFNGFIFVGAILKRLKKEISD